MSEPIFKIGDIVILTAQAQREYKEHNRGWRQDVLGKPFEVQALHTTTTSNGDWVSGPVIGVDCQQAAWNKDLVLFVPLSIEEQVIIKVKQLWIRQPYYKDYAEIQNR